MEHDGAMRRCLRRWRVGFAEQFQGESSSLHGPVERIVSTLSICVTPFLATRSEAALSRGVPGQQLQAAVRCREQLLYVGMEAPPWEDLIRGAVPRNDLDDAEPGVKQGWQFQATQKVEDCYLSRAMWPRLPGPSRALLRSQGGPMAGLPFTSFPTAVHSRFDAQPFRDLFLRRHWLPLPCFRSQLSVWPSTRFQWPPPCSLRSGRKVLQRRGFMVCVGKQAPAVSLNVSSARHGFGLGQTCWTTVDWRLWRTCKTWIPRLAQLAIDTTVVSVLKRDGTPHTRCADVDGAALQAARRRKETTYLELGGQFGRARLVVLGCEVAGRWSDECLSFLGQLARAKVCSEPPLSRWSVLLSCSAARAVAMSLLERRGGTGSDGETPSTLQVLADARDAGVP